MRKQFVRTVHSLMEQDDRIVLLLGDIGVHGFKETFAKFPTRCYNVGVSEQAMISMAAGLAFENKIPIVHTIASFLVERAFEMLKVDFGYQGLGGNFVSVGGSYEYSKLGATHHCPGDVALLKTIPNMEVLIPGHPDEFDILFRRRYDSGDPYYFRLSESSNKELGKNYPRQTGQLGTVVAVGPMLDRTKEACEGLDLTVFYDVTASVTNVDVIVAPFYEDSIPGFHGLFIGVPRKFLTNYGTVAEHDEACGLTAPQIRKRIMEYFNL